MPISNWQTIWQVLWDHAVRDPGPFEIAEVAPEVARRLEVSPAEAEREIAFLLTELSRMPEGRRYFRRVGNAVVAQPGFLAAPKDEGSALSAYPFEL